MPRVDEEGLRLRGGQTARGRITDVPDADGAFEGVDGLLVEDVGNEAVVLLFHEALPVEGDHQAEAVLTAVLKHAKTLVQLGGGGAVWRKMPMMPHIRVGCLRGVGGQIGISSEVGGRSGRRSTGGKPRRRGRRWLTGIAAGSLNRDAAIDRGRATATDSICETYLEDARGRAETSAKERKSTRGGVIEEAA